MSAKRPLGWQSLAAIVTTSLAIGVTASCGSSSATMCLAGMPSSCSCPGGLVSFQVCKMDGSGEGACLCDTGQGGSPPVATVATVASGSTTSSGSGVGGGGASTSSSSGASGSSSCSSASSGAGGAAGSSSSSASSSSSGS